MENNDNLIQFKNNNDLEPNDIDQVKNNKKEEVFLHIYDITNGMASLISESLLGFKIDGIWHTSIEVFNKEYYFQNSLCVSIVGQSSFGNSNKKLSMGFTDCTEDALNQYIEYSKHSWTPKSYNLFDNNCNHFSNMLSSFLVEKEIPSYIFDIKKIKDTDFFKKYFSQLNE